MSSAWDRTAGGVVVSIAAMMSVCGAAAGQSAPMGEPIAGPVVVRGSSRQAGEAGGLGGAAKAARMDRYSAALGLDEDQKKAAAGLYDAYTQSTRQAGEKMHASMKDAQEAIHDGEMKSFEEKMQKAMREQRTTSKAAEKQFLDDLRALLTPGQQDNWAKFERLRRREQLMASFGGVSGSNLDLIKLVDGMGLPAEEKGKLGEALGVYELDLDRVLLERQRVMKEMEEAAGVDAAMHDPEKMAKVSEKQRELDVQVRDLNDKSAKMMADALEEPWKGKLLEKVQQSSFKLVYRESNVSKRVKAAQKLGDLTVKQKEQLKALAEKYQAESRPLNDRWAAAQKRAETAGNADNFPVIVMPGMDGMRGKEDPELAAARTARRDLDRSIRDQMEKVLTPEQLASLPDTSQNAGAVGSAVRVEMIGHGDGDGNMMVFASDDDMPIDMDAEGGPEGGVVIFRTVEVTAPGAGPAPVQTPKK